MPGIDYHELRARVSMRAVLALLGFQPTRIRGAQLRGPCPLHGPSSEKQSRSLAVAPFSVHLEKQVYRCFACGSQGNQLDLWAAARGLPLHAAALDLCRALQFPPPRLLTSHSASPTPKRTPWPTSDRENGLV